MSSDIATGVEGTSDILGERARGVTADNTLMAVRTDHEYVGAGRGG